MKNQDYSYEVFPKVLKVGKKVTVTVRQTKRTPPPASDRMGTLV